MNLNSPRRLCWRLVVPTVQQHAKQALRSSCNGAGRRTFTMQALVVSGRGMGMSCRAHCETSLAPPLQIQGGFRSYSSSRCVSNNTDSNETTRTPTQTTEDAAEEIVYQSPHRWTVLRLRAVSLFTGIGGATGLPLSIYVKGGDPTSLKFWLISGTFGLATLSTTACLTYLFLPYVMEISRIPVRVCHFPKSTTTATTNTEDEKSDAAVPPATTATTTSSPQTKPFLYKAITRSLFLQRQEHFFDPTTELTNYSGFLHPLCNVQIVKKTGGTTSVGIPMYLHPDLVTDPILHKVMSQDPKNGMEPLYTPPPNPDGDLYGSKSK